MSSLAIFAGLALIVLGCAILIGFGIYLYRRR